MSTVGLPSSPTASWKDRAAMSLVLGIVAALAYLPVLDAGFLNWDDPPYVTANPNIGTLSWQTVRWAFTTYAEGIWHPLTWLSLALDHAIYGLSSRGFHSTNLLLHLANTVLVFLTWERMTGAFWRSAIVGALFGLHPMHVESVAWVTERKDVLSTFFWLLTIAAYARYARLRTPTSYALVGLAFVLGLLSKPMVVTLPFVLLLLDYWPLKRFSSGAVLEKLPLLALAAAATLIGVAAVSQVTADAVPDPIPRAVRVANALVSCVRYLWLTAWPFHLSPWYSHPWFEGPPLTAAGVAGASLVLLAVSGLVIAVAARATYAPVGWFWYLGTLAPVLGLVYNGRQGMADRYAYIPHIGLFVLLTWAGAELPAWRSLRGRRLGAVATAVVLVTLGVLTARQTRIWHDDRSFWLYTARVSRYSFIANQALAGMMQGEGRTREASVYYRRAIRLRPELAKVHLQFARLLVRWGRPGAAAAQYRKALALADSADDRYALAQVLLAQHRRASARRELERALALRPDHPDARRSLASLATASVDSGTTP